MIYRGARRRHRGDRPSRTERIREKTSPKQVAIRAERLGKNFGDVVALAPLDLEVAAGEVVGYLGPNGAGKTTTLRLLLGFLRPTSGKAEIFGLDVHRDTVAAHRRIGYVAGETSLWPSLTGAETLHLLGRVQGSVDLAYRDELIERFAFDPSKKVRSYSKGNRQKLGLIAGLMSRADLLLLDEPTSGLDPLMEREFRRCVLEAKQAGQTVFLSSHILSEVEALCDRVAIPALRTAGGGRHARRDATPLGAVGRGDVHRHAARSVTGAGREQHRRGGQPRAPSGARLGGAPARALDGSARDAASEPRALARGAVPRSIRCRAGRQPRSPARGIEEGAWRPTR